MRMNGDYNIDGQVQVGDGSASAPSVTFGNDVDTGIFRSTANTVDISVSGVRGFFVQNISGLPRTILTSTKSNNIGGIDFMIQDNVAAKNSPIIFSRKAGAAGDGSYSFIGFNYFINEAGNNAILNPSKGGWGLTLNNRGSASNDSTLNFEELTSYGTLTTALLISGSASPQLLAGANGTVFRPFYSFVNDTDTGIYLSDNSTMAVAASGLQITKVSTSGLLVTQQGLAPTNNYPALQVQTTPASTNFNALFDLRDSAALYQTSNVASSFRRGTLSGVFTTLSFGMEHQGRLNNAKASWQFGHDTRNTADGSQLFLNAYHTDGSFAFPAFQFVTGDAATKYQLQGLNGAAGTPTYSFINDSDTGMYLAGTNTIGLAGGVTMNGQPAASTSNLTTMKVPAVKIKKTVDQENPGAGTATVQFPSTGAYEYYDSDSMHSFASNPERITFNTSGIYHIHASCARGSTGGLFSVVLNSGIAGGVIIGQSVQTGAGTTPQAISFDHVFNPADYITLTFVGSATLDCSTVATSGFSTSFGATYVGSAS